MEAETAPETELEPELEPEPETEPAAKGRSVSFSNDDESDAETEDSEYDDEDDAPPKIKLTEESVDLGDLVKSLDVPSSKPTFKPDEKVELTVPTDADTLVLKL